jgi:hypothetical protein
MLTNAVMLRFYLIYNRDDDDDDDDACLKCNILWSFLKYAYFNSLPAWGFFTNFYSSNTVLVETPRNIKVQAYTEG